MSDESFFNQIEDYLTHQQCDDAITSLLQSLDQLPDSSLNSAKEFKLLTFIGRAYLQSKDPDNAINYLTRARMIMQEGQGMTELHGVVYFQLGISYKKKGTQGYYELAIANLQKSLEFLPEQSNESLQAQIYLGSCYKGKRDYTKAISYLTNALNLQNNNNNDNDNNKLSKSKIMNNLGLCYKEQRNFAEALEQFTLGQNILEQINSQTEQVQKCLSTLYFNKGNLYYTEKEYNQAIDEYERSKAYENRKGRLQLVQRRITLCYQLLEKYEDAIQSCQKELEETKCGMITHFIMSSLHQLQGNYEQAFEEQKMSIMEVVSEKQRFNMLNILNKMTDESIEQAFKLIFFMENYLNLTREIVQSNHPNIVILLERIARAYFDADCFDVAMQKALACSLLCPEYKFALEIQAACNKKKKLYQQALRLYEQCIILDPAYGDA